MSSGSFLAPGHTAGAEVADIGFFLLPGDDKTVPAHAHVGHIACDELIEDFRYIIALEYIRGEPVPERESVEQGKYAVDIFYR